MANKEWSISFDKEVEKERLPHPKFSESIWWRDCPESNNVVGQRTLINGETWEFTVAGFQGSDGAGYTQLHQEGAVDGKHDGEQEDVFFLTGSGTMTRWDGLDCVRSVKSDTNLLPVLQTEDLNISRFVLAVASYIPNNMGNPDIDLEHLVLNVELDGRTIPVEPVITPSEHYHATHLYAESVYFVVKRKKIRV